MVTQNAVAAGSATTVASVSAPTAPPTEGPQSLYLHSSQARSWRFGHTQLAELRRNGIEQARKRLEEVWKRERALPVVEGEPEASSSQARIETLTLEEEKALVTYYLTRVRQLVKAFGLPELVEATTMTFMKRFYLRNTCMDYHPKNIMLTCLFLAAKAENNAVPLRHFATKLAGKDAKQDAIADYIKTITDHEFLVSQSLAFEYMVHGAHRALHGVFLDVQVSLDPKPDEETLQELLQPARTKLQTLRLTEAEFVYTPAQLALSCIFAASPEGAKLVSRYLEAKGKQQKEVKTRRFDAQEKWKSTARQRLEGKSKVESLPAALLATSAADETDGTISRENVEKVLVRIGDMLTQQEEQGTGDLDRVKVIDKKLKLVQNPEMLPNSRTSKYRSTEQEQNTLGKRDADLDEEGIHSSAGPASKKTKTEV